MKMIFIPIPQGASLSLMIAVARFEIPLGSSQQIFALELEGVRAVLAEAVGFLGGEVGQNLR